jgi:hypothetical protein
MALPTYLGIGVPRAGTTWLHEVLGSHPDVYVPARRKELSFFDLYYHRGERWYRKFFPSGAEAARYRAVGEITPYYFYGPDCPERIARLEIPKLILILRQPVDRAWSYYGQKIRNGMFRGTFEEFLTQSRWPVIEQGYYSRYLDRYRRYFNRDQMLILVFERAMADPSGTKSAVAGFLGLEPTGFPASGPNTVVNASYVPRARGAYGLAFRVSKLCRRYDLDWLVNGVKALGIKQALGVAGEVRPMEAATRRRLDESFQDEISTLEDMLGCSLDLWRAGTPIERPV